MAIREGHIEEVVVCYSPERVWDAAGEAVPFSVRRSRAVRCSSSAGIVPANPAPDRSSPATRGGVPLTETPCQPSMASRRSSSSTALPTSAAFTSRRMAQSAARPGVAAGSGTAPSAHVGPTGVAVTVGGGVGVGGAETCASLALANISPTTTTERTDAQSLRDLISVSGSATPACPPNQGGRHRHPANSITGSALLLSRSSIRPRAGAGAGGQHPCRIPREGCGRGAGALRCRRWR